MNGLARALRKNSTEAEPCLWSRLRGRRLEGVKFRRQQVLGPYVVDFLCLEPKVVIEVDGGQHAEQGSNDLQRTEYLKVLGYRVIRFWNHEVLGDPDAVLESIRAALVDPLTPALSRRERELTEMSYPLRWPCLSGERCRPELIVREKQFTILEK